MPWNTNICEVCNEPIGNEPHDGRMVIYGKARHWRCRPDADIPQMTFSEAIEGVRREAAKMNPNQLEQLNNKLRKITGG